MKRLVIPIVTLMSSIATTSLFAVDVAIDVCGVQAENNGNGHAYIRSCSSIPSYNSCRDFNSSFIYFPIENDASKAMLSTALTAFATRDKVMLRFNGSSNDCSGRYDITRMVRIYR